MTVAMEHGVELGRILEYDLLQITPLFDGDLPSQVNKSTLVVAIEPKVDLEKQKEVSRLTTHIVVDFMSKARQIPLTRCYTFGDLIKSVINSVTSICYDSCYVHLVLDSYIEFSLKECERMRRCDVTPVDLVGMNAETLIPQQLDKFWASDKNKQKL